MKIAASLDGRTALPDGESRWITSAEARADGHLWRSRADVVLTGIGTVLADDPLLDVRLAPAGARLPALAVVDSRLRTPCGARLFGPLRAVHLYHAGPQGPEAAGRFPAGVRCVRCPAPDGDRVDLQGLLADLATQGLQTVHVEAGAVLNGALLRAGLVDELLLYQAPCLIGEGLPLAALGTLPGLAGAWRFAFHEIRLIGPDLFVRAVRIPAPDRVGAPPTLSGLAAAGSPAAPAVGPG